MTNCYSASAISQFNQNVQVAAALINLQLQLQIIQENGVVVRTTLKRAPQFEIVGEPFSLFEEYLAGKDLGYLLSPLSLTPFTKAVLEETAKIPFGKTISYSELAKKIGKPAAQRAVGRALGTNPIPLLIPCHRIIAQDGTLGGFGCGIWIKEKILSFEREHLKKNFS